MDTEFFELIEVLKPDCRDIYTSINFLKTIELYT